MELHRSVPFFNQSGLLSGYGAKAFHLGSVVFVSNRIIYGRVEKTLTHSSHEYNPMGRAVCVYMFTCVNGCSLARVIGIVDFIFFW